ncbi:hypothetical protein ACMVI2_004262 [Salmonella enterica]
MCKRILLTGLFISTIFTACAATAAPQATEIAKKNFEKNLLTPCLSKKEGTHVSIKTPEGLTVSATCKMTAIVDID